MKKFTKRGEMRLFTKSRTPGKKALSAFNNRVSRMFQHSLTNTNLEDHHIVNGVFNRFAKDSSKITFEVLNDGYIGSNDKFPVNGKIYRPNAMDSWSTLMYKIGYDYISKKNGFIFVEREDN